MKDKNKAEEIGGVRFLLEGTVINVVFVSYRKFTRMIPEHAHGENVYEIHFVTEGEGNVFINRQKCSLAPGIMYITGPGVLHEQIPAETNPVIEFGLYLQLEDGVRGGELLKKLRENPDWFGNGKKILRDLANRILSEGGGALPGASELKGHLLAEFFIECIRNIGEEKEREKRLLFPEEDFSAHTVREENLQLVADEIFLYEYRNITLEKLAKRLGLSVRQTQRFLERMYGKTFTRKKLEARMSAALALLNNSGYTITEIAERMGYSSAEHFSYAFSGYYGYAPSSLRKK